MYAYVNFDMARDHVPTYFTRDTNFINAPSLNFITGKTTDYNQNNEVLSNEGELVIFPSQLNHGFDIPCERLTIFENSRQLNSSCITIMINKTALRAHEF